MKISKKIIFIIVLILFILLAIMIISANNARITNNSASDNSVSSSNSVSSNVITISGKNYSVSSNEIDLSLIKLTETKDELLGRLSLFPKLKKVIMCDCGYTNEDMEYLMSKRPDLNFIWMIHPGIWQVRTDAIAFSTLSTEDATYRMTNEDAAMLKYCTNLELLDIGHNAVTDLSFLKYMPDLKILILMGNRDTVNGGYLSDLSDLKYCPKLVYLEIFQNNVSDLSFLEYLPELKDFNMVYNVADDITYLKNLPNIERLYIAYNNFSEEDCIYLQELYPDAQVEYFLRNPIDKGWREHERYYALRNMIKENCHDPAFD